MPLTNFRPTMHHGTAQCLLSRPVRFNVLLCGRCQSHPNMECCSPRKFAFLWSKSISANSDAEPQRCSSSVHASLPFHGVSLYEKIEPSRRLLWSTVLLLVTIISSLFTYQVLKDYNGYQTTTKLTVQQNSTLLMPSLHVCPKNPDHLNYEVLFADIDRRVANLSTETKRDMLLYFIAGVGFMNTEVDKWEHSYRMSVSLLLNSWMDGRTTLAMFKFVFDENGLQCEDILVNCSPINCCKYFKPHYVLLRGRCMRLDNYRQLQGGESHSLRLYFKPTKGFLIDKQWQVDNFAHPYTFDTRGGFKRQIVVHFGDEYPEIARFPRIYVTESEFGVVKFQLRKVSMMQNSERCATDPYQRGQSTCYLNRWLLENIIEPFNCTLPSMQNLRAARGFDICSPHIVVNHYYAIATAATLKNKCTLNCDRWELDYQFWTNVPKKENTFRLDLAFRDLSYEEYVEIAMLSLPGFISQVGGQLGLWLGTSVISLIFAVAYVLEKSAVLSRRRGN